MAYKYQLGTAILSGALSPGADNSFDIGAEGAAWNDLHLSGTAYIVNVGSAGDPVDTVRVKASGLYIGNTGAGVQVTATGTELNYNDISTLGTAETSKTVTVSAADKITLGAIEIEGTAFDVNGGTVDGITSLTVAADATFTAGVDGNGSDVKFFSDTAGDYMEWDTSAKCLNIVGTDGSNALNVSDGDVAISDTLTVTTGINGPIGVDSLASGSFTMLSASQDLNVVGNANLNSNLEVKGTVINFPGVVPASLDTGDLILSLDATSKDLQTRTRANVITDFAGVMAGTVTDTGLSDSSGVLSIDIANLNAEVIATGDKLIFADADDSLHSETIDDLMTKGLALTTDATMDLADDYIVFLDGGASGDGKKEKWSEIVTAMAGSGISATDGVLSSDASPEPTDHGNANATLVQGFNFSSVVFATSGKTWTLPANPDPGDVVTVKAPSNADTFPLTIAGASDRLIDGEASLILDSPYGAVALVAASGSTTGIDWYIK